MGKKKVEGSEERVVLRIALLSRLLLLILIVLWRLIFLPYDTSASLNPSCLSAAAGDGVPKTGDVLWPRVGAAIEASVVWDGVYFVRIAECGYEYEQTYAFLPLLPACIALLSRSGWLKFGSFICSTLKNRSLDVVMALFRVLTTSLLFLFPVAVFVPLVPIIGYRAVLALSDVLDRYSESLYALLSLGGIYYIFSGANTVAMLLLALSGSARSPHLLHAATWPATPSSAAVAFAATYNCNCRAHSHILCHSPWSRIATVL
ncbi:hypothetical protein B296_00015850 [Ensete ventricosum]|uniref:GPI mannosyltransferase 2 n=1 Tax=Ensete ventricosum TaxID=4639 RepID=A0A426YTN4_ENSVE|nr:hypothetical protein B296_00015850 [Ensete ventricosum]